MSQTEIDLEIGADQTAPASPAAAPDSEFAASHLAAQTDESIKDSAINWNWVPVRSMTERHRPRLLQHLLRLDQHDRYLRFGFQASDAQIQKYVEGLDFERDEVLGIFNRRLELIAAAHLAYAPAPQLDDRPAMAEFGVAVLPLARGRHFGARLFDHAILHARNRGVETLFIHALSENAAMLKIARNAGAQVVREGSESEAWLKLPPETIASHFDEVVGQHAAEIDYQFKWHANRAHALWDVLSDVRNPFACKQKAANE